MLSKNKQVDLNSIKEKGQLNTQILNPDFYFLSQKKVGRDSLSMHQIQSNEASNFKHTNLNDQISSTNTLKSYNNDVTNNSNIDAKNQETSLK